MFSNSELGPDHRFDFVTGRTDLAISLSWSMCFCCARSKLFERS